MSSQTKIKSDCIHFSDLFSSNENNEFKVPWHQRRYDWEKLEVESLLHDIGDAVKNNQPFYFLGSLLLIDKGNSTWEINDGQQRMMTYSLICACLLKRFHYDENAGGGGHPRPRTQP